MKTQKSKTEKINEKLIEKAISVHYDACAYHRVKRKKPVTELTQILPAFIVLKDEKGEIASITRCKKHLYFALNGVTHAQEI